MVTLAGGQIADENVRGISPRQHHDKKTPIEDRIVTYSARVDGFDEDLDPFAGGEISGDTHGDDVCWFHWPRVKAKRAMSAWAVAFPSVVTKAPKGQVAACLNKAKPKRKRAPKTRARRRAVANALLPLFEVDKPDDRFQELGARDAMPPWASRFPVDWTGTVQAGVNERAQARTFQPAALGLVAANRGGDPELGTRVFDTTKEGKVDRDRWRELQALVAVLDMTPGGCGVTGKALGLQFGRAGWMEDKAGYLPLVDENLCEIGLPHFDFGGGPLQVNTKGKTCQHNGFGTDADGRVLRPAHIPHRALIISPAGADGPAFYQDANFRPLSDKVGRHWNRVDCRFNREIFHQACGKVFPGFWDWQVRIPWFQLPETGNGDDDDDDEELDDSDQDERNPKVCEEKGKRSYPATERRVALPSIAFYGTPNERGQPELLDSDGKLTETQEAALFQASLLGCMTGVARGDGTQRGMKTRVRRRWNVGDGTVTAHPHSAKIADLLDGLYDPHTPDNLEEEEMLRVLFPGGLATLDFAHPRRDTSGMTGKGSRIQQVEDATCWDVTDENGDPTGTEQIELSATKPEAVNITGGLNVDGTPIVGGGGETNTASNVNVGGVGVFKTKTGVDLEFRGVNAGSSKVTVTLDAGNNEIDVDVDQSQLAPLLAQPGGDQTWVGGLGGTDDLTIKGNTTSPLELLFDDSLSCFRFSDCLQVDDTGIISRVDSLTSGANALDLLVRGSDEVTNRGGRSEKVAIFDVVLTSGTSSTTVVGAIPAGRRLKSVSARVQGDPGRIMLVGVADDTDAFALALPRAVGSTLTALDHTVKVSDLWSPDAQDLVITAQILTFTSTETVRVTITFADDVAPQE